MEKRKRANSPKDWRSRHLESFGELALVFWRDLQSFGELALVFWRVGFSLLASWARSLVLYSPRLASPKTATSFLAIWAEFTSVSTRENLVMSTIASGKYCALQSSHKKISTSDKVIWTIGKSYQFLSNSSQFISGFLNLFQIVLNLFQFSRP